jgi:Zn-dependent protease/CBS domain-containing protein
MHFVFVHIDKKMSPRGAMFEKRVKIFHLLGFDVHVDASWLLLAFLIVWTLAKGLFPFYYEDLAPTTYWVMGVAGALGLFISIILHELSHSLVARRYGLSMKGITLFVFGGVAQMDEEPASAKAEFMMAVAGPIASVMLSGLAALVGFVGKMLSWPVTVTGVIDYLAWINLVLAIFNLVPAFPLDGGRILRSILWQWRKNLKWATKIASVLGSAFGVVLMILGGLSLLQGHLIQGLWWIMIGWFVRYASKTSYSQLLLRSSLEGEPVHRFMRPDPVAVSKTLSVADLVDQYIYRYHYKMFPVVEEGRLTGCVTTREIKELPRTAWNRTLVGDIAKPRTDTNTIQRETDALKALMLMNRTGNTRLIVAEGDHLAGVLTLKDLLSFLSFKLDLEGDEAAASLTKPSRT